MHTKLLMAVQFKGVDSFLLVLIKFVVVVLVANIGVLVSGMCIEREREALLDFKRGLIDEHHLLWSWGREEDCCRWYGVRCSNTTGHVAAILLGDTDNYPGFREYKNIMGLLKLIDLSSNKLVGSIPKAFSNLRGLISLNLSRNSLTGNMDPNMGEMEMLESLDLSTNQISGEIPKSMTQLHFLSKLDLANNNLWGKIPESTQLQSFNESVFGGNPLLCGKPLNLCPEDDSRPSATGEDIKEENDGVFSPSFMQEFGISMAFGFIFGFWGVVGALVQKKSWRRAYFKFLDAIGDWLHVTSLLLLNNFTRN